MYFRPPLFLPPFCHFFFATVTAIIITRYSVVGLVLQEDAGLIVSATDDGRLHCNSTTDDLRDVSLRKATRGADAGAEMMGIGTGMDAVQHDDTNLVTFLDR